MFVRIVTQHAPMHTAHTLNSKFKVLSGFLLSCLLACFEHNKSAFITKNMVLDQIQDTCTCMYFPDNTECLIT